MSSSAVRWKERAEQDLIQNLAVPQAMMVRGEGCYLWDDQGNRYLDFLGGIAVNSLGHCHPVFVEAVSQQAATLGHVSNYFITPPQLALAERLLRLAGASGNGRVFFANSGTEANEAALKMARLHGNKVGKTKILAFEEAFHGRTMGALALTSKDKYRDPFAPMLSGVEHIELSIAALEAAMDDSVAAVFLEPILGEAGVVELPEGLLVAARELTKKHGALLILDEVQTGAGRTGEWFAFQSEGIVPDAVTLAKGMGGGFPIGALIAFGSPASLFYPGSHGTTFGGNPLACHVADRVLAEIETGGILANVSARSQQIRDGIEALDSELVSEVRGQGLLLGVVLTQPVAAQIAAAAFAGGLIINAPAPNVIRLAPPLIVGEGEVTKFLEQLGQVIETITK